MDLLEATESTIKRKVGAQECTFTILNAYDRAELLRPEIQLRDEAVKAEREKLLANLKAAGIEGEQAFTELETFRERSPRGATESDWIDLANDPTKEVAIFTASLRAVHGAQADELAKLARLTLMDKAKLMGLGPKEPEKEGATPDPNPQPAIPTSYGTPVTNSTGSNLPTELSTTSPT